MSIGTGVFLPPKLCCLVAGRRALLDVGTAAAGAARTAGAGVCGADPILGCCHVGSAFRDGWTSWFGFSRGTWNGNLCLDGSEETEKTVEVFRLEMLPAAETAEDTDGRIEEVLKFKFNINYLKPMWWRKRYRAMPLCLSGLVSNPGIGFFGSE